MIKGLGLYRCTQYILCFFKGTKSRTRRINLDTSFHDDFESGQTDVFEREGVDVGDVVMIQMSLSSVLPGRLWLLDHVTVGEVGGERTAFFPCDQWLTSAHPSVCLRRSEGKAALSNGCLSFLVNMVLHGNVPRLFVSIVS